MGDRGAPVARCRAHAQAAGAGGNRAGEARSERVVVAPGLLVGHFQACGEGVLDRAGAEIAAQIALQGLGPGFADAAVGPAPHAVVDDEVTLAVVRLGPQVVVARLARHQRAAPHERVGEMTLELDRADVLLRLLEIARQQPVVGVVRYLQWATAAGSEVVRVVVGDAAVGDVVGLQVVVVHRQAVVGAQAEGDRRRHAPARVLRAAAVGDVVAVGHRVQAQGDAVADGLIDVHGGAPVLVGAQAQAAGDEVARLGRLGDQVDAAAHSAAAGVGRAGALGHLDLVDGEGFAAARTGAAYPVDEDRVLRVEAADDRAVAIGIATLAGTEGDARHRAQRIQQVGGGRFLQHLLRDHRDRARRVQQRRGELGRGGRRSTPALHVDRVQLGGPGSGWILLAIALGVGIAGAGRRLRRLGQGRSGHRHQQGRAKRGAVHGHTDSTADRADPPGTGRAGLSDRLAEAAGRDAVDPGRTGSGRAAC